MVNKALFLDRDGTINVDTGYTYRIDDFCLIDGIIDLCRVAVNAGYKIIVVTNQSGIARGYFSCDDFAVITAYMKKLFLQEGIEITDVFFCPELSGPDRKPESGLFFKAKNKYDLDMAQSVSVGDRERDIEAALNAGVGKNFLLDTTIKQSKATAVVQTLKEVIPFLTDN